jgi:DNA-binding transcriptional MocR family regulator
MNRYQTLAALLGERITQGLYPAGEKLPSVRTLSLEHGVSISTVQQAYHLLEEQQMILARAKSGYFVAQQKNLPELPEVCKLVQRPVEISQWEQVLELIDHAPRPGIVELGRGTPDLSSPTLKPLLRALRQVAQYQQESILTYESIYGHQPLREQIARLMIDSGNHISAEQIIMTHGCSEALSIALRTLCQAGDIVAIDSPSFHGAMQSLKGLQIKVIEIPADPITGISLEALELALEQWPIKALQLTPNCNNPLGYNMPDDRKKQLLRLAQRYDLAIIEDDIYGELAYHYPRPATIASFDEDGRVLLCSSFSKSLAPGLRVGWIAPGRYFNKALHTKYISTGNSAPLPQLAVCEYIQQGHYSKHIRRMRAQYQRNAAIMTDWVRRYFPSGTRLSRPQGGFMLWVALDEKIDTKQLNRLIAKFGVQVATGAIFSAAGKYRHCLRINYSHPLTEHYQQAIAKIGDTIRQLLASD